MNAEEPDETGTARRMSDSILDRHFHHRKPGANLQYRHFAVMADIGDLVYG